MKKISNVEMWLFLGSLATIDLVQFVLTLLLGIGLIANRFVDIVVGGYFLLYAKFRNNLDQKLTISICAAFIGEEIPLIDVLPLWTLDGWYFRSLYKAKLAAYEAEEAAKAEAEEETRRNEIISIATANYYNQIENQENDSLRSDSLRKAA